MLAGVPFATAVTVFSHHEHPGSWPRDIIGGLVAGIFFGVVMGRWAIGMIRAGSEAAGDLPARDLKTAQRAAQRGPVPLDPDIRRAAARLADHNLKQSLRVRWLGPIPFTFMTADYVWLAVGGTPWWWAAAAASAALAVAYLIWPSRLRRRSEVLNEGIEP